jgi:hypothetical protein
MNCNNIEFEKNIYNGFTIGLGFLVAKSLMNICFIVSRYIFSRYDTTNCNCENCNCDNCNCEILKDSENENECENENENENENKKKI